MARMLARKELLRRHAGALAEVSEMRRRLTHKVGLWVTL